MQARKKKKKKRLIPTADWAILKYSKHAEKQLILGLAHRHSFCPLFSGAKASWDCCKIPQLWFLCKLQKKKKHFFSFKE